MKTQQLKVLMIILVIVLVAVIIFIVATNDVMMFKINNFIDFLFPISK